jgi:heat shock protein HspQ
MSGEAQFAIGETIRHVLFQSRGVIYAVDPVYQGSEEWYRQVARTRPPKDQPWYRVLVDGGQHETYVAQRNLEPDGSGEPVNHPLVNRFFASYRDGVYVPRNRAN